MPEGLVSRRQCEMLEAQEAGSWAGVVLNSGSVTYFLCSLGDKLLL